MDDRRFKDHLEHHGYLMGSSSCYVPGAGNVCSSDIRERYLLPECETCLKHFANLEGEPIPEVLYSDGCSTNNLFIEWKTMQMIAIRRLTEEYTEEQAAIVREEYIKLSMPKTEPDPAEQNKQNILTQLFG